MRVRFLGTGAAGGTPGRGRSGRCESSLLVEEPARVLIDVTTHFERQAAALDGLDAVLLTHAHRDASGGLERLRRWWLRHASSELPVHASPEAVRVLDGRLRSSEGLRLVGVEPGERRRRAGLSVTALEVPHARERRYRTYAWRLTGAGRTLVYASDVAVLTPELRRFARGAPLLVIDAAMWRRQIFSHLTIDRALPELCDWPVDRILLTQIGRSVPDHELLEREAARLCPRAAPAYDGLDMEV